MRHWDLSNPIRAGFPLNLLSEMLQIVRVAYLEPGLFGTWAYLDPATFGSGPVWTKLGTVDALVVSLFQIWVSTLVLPRYKFV